MGSGFTPSGIYSSKLAALAGVLAECSAYAAFVGAEVAEDGVGGMYFYGIDRRDLAALNEDFPPRFVIWGFGEDYEKFSVQSGGTTFRWRGSLTLTVEGDTPTAFAGSTPKALNWIMGQMEAMVGQMEVLFGEGGRPEISGHKVLEGPYREGEEGVVDFCSVTVAFEIRN